MPYIGGELSNSYIGPSPAGGAAGGGGGGGATGGNGDEIFYENGQAITANYTVISTKNAMTAGPVDINDGVTVTVEAGGRWVVI